MDQCPACGKPLSSPSPMCPWCNALLVNPSAGKVADTSKRFLAFLIDWGVGFIVGFILGVTFPGISTGAAGAVGLAVQVAFWTKGQSPGKMLMKLQVYTVAGQPATFFVMFLREVVGKFLSGIAIGIGFLVILWDPARRGWHDKIASTVVIDTATAVTSTPASTQGGLS